MDTYSTTITDKTYETDTTLFITLERPDDFSFEAGQFITIPITDDDTTLYKQYSIYSHPATSSLRLCVKLIPDGFASTYFEAVEPGAPLDIMGPLGQFTLHDAVPHHMFLATGVGIAPMHSLVHDALADDATTAALYHGVRREEELIDQRTFQSLDDEHDRFTYHPVLSRTASASKHGYVQDHTPIQDNTAYYLCGVADFVHETRQFLNDNQVSEALIKTERFT